MMQLFNEVDVIVMNRDSERTSFEDVFSLKEGLILTDPPYNDHLVVQRLNLHRKEGFNCVMFYASGEHIDGAYEYQYWLKPESTKNFIKKCGRFVEHIAVFRNNKVFNQLHWSQMTGIHKNRILEKTEHPFQKPIDLLEKLIRIYSNKGNVVFDPFAGSGATALAAVRSKRKCVVVERDEKYYNLIIDNLKAEGINFLEA